MSRSCKNLLCAFDTSGAPVIVPVHDVEYLFSTTVDKSESVSYTHLSGGSADGIDDYVITENYYNHETLGQIKIRKIGNVLTGYENGQFVYESDNLANATYEIHAQGDIPTPDNHCLLYTSRGDPAQPTPTSTRR